MRRLVGVLIVLNLAGAGYVVVDGLGEAAEVPLAAPTSTTATTRPRPTTTSAPPTTTTRPPPPPTAAPTTTTVPPPVAPSASAYRGLGSWVDVFDWSPAYMGPGQAAPAVRPDDVEAMAGLGIRTLYIQASRDDERTAGELESPDLLADFLVRAHAHGMRVVAWYLPKRYDDADLRRFVAIAAFAPGGHRFDGIAADIEWRRDVPTDERNRRLVDLSRRLREAVPDRPLAAIVLPPVVTDVINLAYWPGFPWREIAPFYDVWMPMAYWTNREDGSEWRDAHRYTAENVRRVREHLADPGAFVHPIGGIGDRSTADDYQAFVRAAHEAASIGASVYDFRTTAPDAWEALRGAPDPV